MMTRRSGWTLIVLLGLIAAAHPSGAQVTAEKETVAVAMPVWLEPGPATEEERGFIRLDCDKVQSSDAPIVLECAFSANDPIDNGLLRLKILDANKALVYETERHVVVDKQGGACSIEWNAGEIPPGAYTVSLELLRPPVFQAAQRDYELYKMSADACRAQFDALKMRLDGTLERLKTLESQGAALPYARMRLMLAKRFLPQTGDAIEHANWPRAHSLVAYLESALGRVERVLDSTSPIPEFREAIPMPAPRGLAIEDGEFVADGRPLFLLGACLGDVPSADDIARLGESGLNFASCLLGPNQTLKDASSTADLDGKYGPVFKTAEDAQVGIAVSLDPAAMPAWVAERMPELMDSDSHGADITKPEAFPLVERHIKAAGEYLNKQPALLGVSLINNPNFKFTGEEVRLGFLAAMKAQYKDRHAVNRAWKGLFADLNEIQIGWTKDNPRYQDSPAYRYDWQRYQLSLGSEFLDRLRNAAHASISAPLMIGFSDDAFVPGEAEHGVDREALASVMDLNGCCAMNSHVGPFYALGYPQEVLTYTLMRSFAPDKPLLNLQDRIASETGTGSFCTGDYVHAVMWEAAMAGLNGSALDTPLGEMRPECLDAYATACLDLNRLAPIVAAFQRAPAEVAILWSMPSKIYAGGTQHLESARFAFEGCSFAGYKMRFISEKQCREDQLGSIKVLVVPDTPAVDNETFPILKDFMQGDGVIVRTASSILYDEHGQSRRDIISTVRKTLLVRGQNLPAEYLHAMDAVAVSGDLPVVPRTVNEYDYPIEGVKSRYVELDGKGYLYLVNLRKSAAKAYLYKCNWAGRDLIGGRDVRFPLELQPLDPMLIRLDEQVPLHPPKPKRALERFRDNVLRSLHLKRAPEKHQDAPGQASQ